MPRSFVTRTVSRSGLTLIDTLFLTIVVMVIVAMFVPTLSMARSNAQGPPDAARMRSIHEAWLTYAASNDGIYPTPGLINRQSVMGTQIPGAGAEDKLVNHTANVHSACIMLGLYMPETCIGTTEPNPNVLAKSDYNFDIYDPSADQFWDPTFQADLSTESNISYASMPIARERQDSHWRDSGDAQWTIISNRGVRDGHEEPNHYDESITLLIHGNRKRWEGFVCFSDNHLERIREFRPNDFTYEIWEGEFVPDNIFRNEFYGVTTSNLAYGSDRWLVISRSFIGTPDNVQWMVNSWD